MDSRSVQNKAGEVEEKPRPLLYLKSGSSSQTVHLIEKCLPLADKPDGFLGADALPLECGTLQESIDLSGKWIALARDRNELIFDPGKSVVAGGVAFQCNWDFIRPPELKWMVVSIDDWSRRAK